MTQKELLYVEDAIGHENNIICILEDGIHKLKDKDLVSFFEKEEKKHKDTCKKLMTLLEETCNE